MSKLDDDNFEQSEECKKMKSDVDVYPVKCRKSLKSSF